MVGQPFEWKLYDFDRPSNLKERLLAHGFSAGGPCMSPSPKETTACRA